MYMLLVLNKYVANWHDSYLHMFSFSGAHNKLFAFTETLAGWDIKRGLITATKRLYWKIHCLHWVFTSAEKTTLAFVCMLCNYLIKQRKTLPGGLKIFSHTMQTFWPKVRLHRLWAEGDSIVAFLLGYEASTFNHLADIFIQSSLQHSTDTRFHL